MLKIAFYGWTLYKKLDNSYVLLLFVKALQMSNDEIHVFASQKRGVIETAFSLKKLVVSHPQIKLKIDVAARVRY